LPKKKKKTIENKKAVDIVQSLDGWNIGDMAWAVAMGDTKPMQFEITSFHPNDATAPAVTGTCISTGKSRTVAIDWCEDTRPMAKKNFEKRRSKKC